MTRRTNEVDYELIVNGQKKVFHINMLKQYEERRPERPPEIACMVLTEEVGSDVEVPTFNAERRLGVKDVIINPGVGERETSELKGLFQKYQKVFSDLPGRTNVVECQLRVTSDKPVHIRQYPLPLVVQDAVEEEVGDMLRQGIIERSTSAYNAPLVPVKKPDGTLRVCVDFRGLNKILVSDAEPIPRVDVVFAKVAGKKYFSKLDLTKGYWQIPMEESSKEKTAFSCSQGLFQFRFMPFGLKTAAATFTKLMRTVLNGLRNVEHYIDDILIATDTWEEHLDTLEELFRRIQQAGMTIKPSKCKFGYSDITFLGHKLGMGRVATKEDILEKIQAARPPKTKKEVQSFLGLTGFYREFIPHYAEVANPLVELTKKGASNAVKWTSEHDKAFATLKQHMAAPPVLLAPNLQEEFVLRTDASNVALGAVLLQEKDS